MTHRIVPVLALLATACAAGGLPAREPPSAASPEVPTTAATAVTADRGPAAPPRAASDAAPAGSVAAPPASVPANAPTVTFATKNFAPGMVVEFSRMTHRQSVSTKGGVAGQATVRDATVGGSILVKEVDPDHSVVAAEIAFLATSTDALGAPGASGTGAAFYAGKRFLARRRPGTGSLEITDVQGKPNLATASEISFVASVASQFVPFFGAHTLAGKVTGRTLGLGARVDELASFVPVMLGGRNREVTFARMEAGAARFEVRTSDAHTSPPTQDGSSGLTSTTQLEGYVLVPPTTSQWTTVRSNRTYQSESAKLQLSSTEETTVTRTFK